MKWAALRRPGVWLGAILCLYALLILPTVARQGISWDEQTDLTIARAYLARPDGWLAGSPDDPSQTRLPMAAVALVFQLLGRSDLLTGRLVSVVAGGLTLVAVYLYGRERFDPVRALLACVLLATSPFFLSFARVAFTETDIYLACTLMWLLVCADRLRRRFTIGQAAWMGVVLGLGCSAKITLLTVLPAVWFAVWKASRAAPAERPHLRIKFETAAAFAWSLVCIAAGLLVSRLLPPQAYQGGLRLAHTLAILAGWIGLLAWAWRRRSQTTSPLWMAAFVTGLAALTFFVIPPEHLTNTAILRSLNERITYEMEWKTQFMREAASLHVLSILVKSSPLIGAGMLLSAVLSIAQWRKRPEIRLGVLVALGYFAGLLLLPLAQTFYMIPILPILAVWTADQFMRLYAWRPKLAVVPALLAAGLLAVDLVLCYPDFNLNGYQYLGARQIAGRPSIGYRSIVQTPSDGVQQAFEWLNENAKPGEQVLAYVYPWHIVEATALHPPYAIESGLFGKAITPDYVVTEINTHIPQDWWIETSPDGPVFDPLYNPNWLKNNYQKVFSVTRAFGIEMASVWKKK